MKILSYNVNGIRAAITKDLFAWLEAANPEIICIQESKAEVAKIDVESFEKLGYKSYWHSAVKKGYSGVGIATKQTPKQVVYGCGIDKYDVEGRIIRADYQDFSVISVYVPSASNIDRLGYKMEFCRDLLLYIKKLQTEIPNLIICGDFNICHKPIDIHNPVGLKNVSGFLPEEREWLSQFITQCQLVDTFRLFSQEPDQYTWWSYRQQSRERNKGWRIDYHFASKTLENKLKRSIILPEAKHSDHCPILLEIDI